MLKRKSKRVLSIVLAVAMIVGLFPVAAFAEGGESATPVDQNTETVATKLPGADKTGVIKLTSNVMLKDTYTISQDTTVTIDLAGFKITNAEGKHTIVNNGNLTISDTSAEKNGTVDNISHARAALFNNPTGTVTLNGGTFDRSQENENSPDNSGNNSFYTIRNYGKMTINSGTTVRQKGHFSSMVTNGWYNVSNPSGQSEPIDTSSTPTLIINGGTFTGGLNTIKNDDKGVLIINDGNFSNVAQSVVQNHNITTIAGGTFTTTPGEGSPAETYVIDNHGISAPNNCGTLTISGGTFSGATYALWDRSVAGSNAQISISGGSFEGETAIAKAPSTNGNISITGGTFKDTKEGTTTSSANQFIVEGNELNENGTVVINNDTAVASVDGVGYTTLKAAIENVATNGTITILRDIPDAIGISVPTGKNFTIDFAGHTYTLTDPGAGSSGTETNGFQLLKDSTIVFKNGTIKIAEGAKNIKRIIQSYANVTFEDMNFYAENQVDGENHALSFNYGNVVFKGDSNIYVTDPSDTIAFDVCRWTAGGYEEVSVTFTDDYSGTVQGTVIYDSNDGKKGKLNIEGNGGTFTKIDTSAGSDTAAATGISVSGGKYATAPDSEWLDDSLNAELYSQQSGLYSYFTSLEAAIAAAQPGDKVVDLTETENETTYTVTIKYNNGDEDLMLTVSKNKELTLPAAPSREDYKFDGWIINGERYVTGAKVAITANTIISADWQPPYTGKYSYEIFTKVGDNGAIDVDRYATEGDKVTITVSPDEAYMLDEMTLTSGGKDVEVTDNGDGTYTFTMPSGDVKIEVTFAEDPNWEEEPAMPFVDVDENDWFYDVVLYAYENGLMTGTSADTFAPNQTTTRGMIVSMLARLEGVTSAEDAGFADVAANDWYATAVNWAASVGVVNGYEDNTFRPNAPITREQMAAILYNYADYKGYDVSARADLSDYADAADVSSWAEDVLAWANAEGLINGMTATTIDPQGATTRAQTAAMFERFLTAHEA